MRGLTILLLSSVALLAGCDRAKAPKSEEAASPTPADTAAEALPTEEPVSAATSDAIKAQCPTITTEGFCGVKFGMTDAEARAAFPGGLPASDDANDPDFESCYYLGIAPGNYEIGFMVLEGKVERIDVNADWLSTPQGARIGMALDDVEKLYAGSTREANHYNPEAEDLTSPLGGDIFAVFEESNAGIVTGFRVGRKPAVQFVEGCA